MNYCPPFPEPSQQVTTVYYKQGCPFSMNALKLLQNRGILYQAWEANALTDIAHNNGFPDVKSFMDKNLARYGFRNHQTWPAIFMPIKGKIVFIGGFQELQKAMQPRDLTW